MVCVYVVCKATLKKIYYTISKERYKIFVLYERSLIETVPFSHVMTFLVAETVDNTIF